VSVVVVAACLWCYCCADKVPPQFELDLDLPPRQRWIKIYKQLFGMSDYASAVKSSMEEKLQILRAGGCSDECVKRLSTVYKQRFPDYYEEIVGFTDLFKFVNLTTDELVAVQSNYEVSILNISGVDDLLLPYGGPGCTSVLTCDERNRVMHGRNLDWANAHTFAQLMFRVNFTRNKQLLFQSDQIPGHVGVLTGVRLGAFSVSINARRLEQNPSLEQFLDCMDAIPMQPAMSSFRYAMENFKTFDELYKNVTTTPVCAARYSIIGSADGRGTRIQHIDDYDNHTAIFFEEQLQCTNQSWFIAQCNSDLNVSRSDDIRRDTVMKELESEGRDYATTSVGLFRAMTVPKVKNAKTVHTSIMSPITGSIVTVAYDF